MKKSQHRLSALKHEMFELRNKGKSRCYKVLKADEADYLGNFFYLKPCDYRVALNFPENFSPVGAPAIVKKLFHEKKKGQTRSIIKLYKNQLKQLVDAGLTPIPRQYCIYLQ